VSGSESTTTGKSGSASSSTAGHGTSDSGTEDDTIITDSANDTIITDSANDQVDNLSVENGQHAHGVHLDATALNQEETNTASDQTQASAKSDTNATQTTNQSGEKLPQTDETTSPVAPVTGLAALGLAFLRLFGFKRKKKDDGDGDK
jgi:LPXTG-motif cell wall-anchored protein